MCTASRRGNTGRMRQNAVRRVILSDHAPANDRFFTASMPICSMISVFFRNRSGVFLAFPETKHASVSSHVEADR